MLDWTSADPSLSWTARRAHRSSCGGRRFTANRPMVAAGYEPEHQHELQPRDEYHHPPRIWCAFSPNKSRSTSPSSDCDDAVGCQRCLHGFGIVPSALSADTSLENGRFVAMTLPCERTNRRSCVNWLRATHLASWRARQGRRRRSQEN